MTLITYTWSSLVVKVTEKCVGGESINQVYRGNIIVIVDALTNQHS